MYRARQGLGERPHRGAWLTARLIGEAKRFFPPADLHEELGELDYETRLARGHADELAVLGG